MFSFKCNMNKRGQIALFVIIGILLVAAIILVYSFRSDLFGIALSPEEAQKVVTSQIEPVRGYTSECMTLAAERTLATMGRQGGYVLPRTNHFSIPPVMSDAPIISYALFYDPDRGYVKEMPSLNTMEDEMTTYLENNFDFIECINNYEPFESLVDIEILNAAPIIDKENIDMGEESGIIFVPYSYPVKISRGNASTLVENYEMAIPLNLARIRETAARVTNKVAAGENYMDVIAEEGDIEWQQLREDANAEKMLVSAETYTAPFTELTGETYNEKNILFNIEYQNEGLDVPYNFYFLVGKA